MPRCVYSQSPPMHTAQTVLIENRPPNSSCFPGMRVYLSPCTRNMSACLCHQAETGRWTKVWEGVGERGEARLLLVCQGFRFVGTICVESLGRGARLLSQPLRFFILHPCLWAFILESNGTLRCRRGLGEDRECGQVPREAQINISFSLSLAGGLRLTCLFRQQASRVRQVQRHAGYWWQGRWTYTRKHGQPKI